MQPVQQPSGRQVRALPPSTIVAFPARGVVARSHDWTEEVDLNSIEDTCKFLQRELIATKRKFSDLAHRAGCCASTVAKIAYGDTKSPRHATVLLLLAVLGFSLVARR